MNVTMESIWSEIGDKSYGIYLAITPEMINNQNGCAK